MFLDGLLRKVFADKRDITEKVLERYRKKEPVSTLAKSLFIDEDCESINRRFAQARAVARKKYR